MNWESKGNYPHLIQFEMHVNNVFRLEALVPTMKSVRFCIPFCVCVAQVKCSCFTNYEYVQTAYFVL